MGLAWVAGMSLKAALAKAMGAQQEPRVTTFNTWRQTVESAVASARQNGSRTPPGRSVFGSNPLRPVRETAMSQAARQAVGLQAADSCCPKLSFKERLHGVAACFFGGMVLSLLGTMFWWTGKTRPFAILYTLGNVVSICGTGFLIGPKRQERLVISCVV